MTITDDDFVLDVSLTCAGCFADQASAEAWALLERLPIAIDPAHLSTAWRDTLALARSQPGGRSPAVDLNGLPPWPGLPS